MVGNDPTVPGPSIPWVTARIAPGSSPAGRLAPVAAFAASLPRPKSMLCRIFPGGRFSDWFRRLDYCMENGIDVANMSLGGGDPSQIIEERILRAKQMGMACIVAAGNSSGPVQFPASSPHCLAVAAMGKWGEFPDDSYHAQQALDGFQSQRRIFSGEVQLLRAGRLTSAHRASASSPRFRRTVSAPGTAPRCDPHVTGLAALVLAHHPDSRAFSRRATGGAWNGCSRS